MPVVHRFDEATQQWVMEEVREVAVKAAPRRVSIPKLLPMVLVPLVVLGAGIALWPKEPQREVVPVATVPSAPAVPSEPPLIAPKYGKLTLGSYAGEAAQVAGLHTSSTTAFSDPKAYETYRRSVRFAFGVDLEDMNYFSVGTRDWERRIPGLEKWMLMAGKYGDVTVALEPTGPEKFGVFRKSKGMTRLRKAFETAEKEGITVWVRFASEANLKGSVYSAFGRSKSIDFYRRACWFKDNMPDNVRMVFSPLINTVIAGWRNQQSTIRWMLKGDASTGDLVSPWDRVGGTLYRTDMPLRPTYDLYYNRMKEIEPLLPFQLCELGGPFGGRSEMLEFLEMAKKGRWRKLEKVNLFARNINKRADPNAQFGFINPKLRAEASRLSHIDGKPRFLRSYLQRVLSAN